MIRVHKAHIAAETCDKILKNMRATVSEFLKHGDSEQFGKNIDTCHRQALSLCALLEGIKSGANVLPFKGANDDVAVSETRKAPKEEEEPKPTA